MCPLVFLDEVCNVIKLEDLDVILSLSLSTFLCDIGIITKYFWALAIEDTDTSPG